MPKRKISVSSSSEEVKDLQCNEKCPSEETLGPLDVVPYNNRYYGSRIQESIADMFDLSGSTGNSSISSGRGQADSQMVEQNHSFSGRGSNRIEHDSITTYLLFNMVIAI